ncbi:hypothetical protein [Planctomycetes bacterium Poly30]
MVGFIEGPALSGDADGKDGLTASLPDSFAASTVTTRIVGRDQATPNEPEPFQAAPVPARVEDPLSGASLPEESPVPEDSGHETESRHESDSQETPSTKSGPPKSAPEKRAQARDRMSAANQRARWIAREVSSQPIATAAAAQRNDAREESQAQPRRGAGMGTSQTPGTEPALAPWSRSNAGSPAAAAPRQVPSTAEPKNVDPGAPAPNISSSEVLDLGLRQLLFVWDSSVVLDEARSAELLAFAAQRGFDTLAVEATAVGYHDAAQTGAFERFTEDARGLGIETFALIGYPWFTVSAGASLPGQPTSSLEGLAVLETIVRTGFFDGIVDDSHPYGVEYESGGETRNWLFDEPAAAGLDLQAWLRSAKAVAGSLPLVKTTPFWFDSHPALQDIVDLDGQGFLTLAHLVAREVDATAVLAYRDDFNGPNGILELVSGEMTMGPAILTLETGDLGADLDYLTFHEEGLRPLEAMIERLSAELGTFWSFRGAGVHHYGPLDVMADELLSEESFGFVGFDSVAAQNGALIDAYDSSLGRYYDQMSYQSAIGTVAVLGQGAVVSNGDIKLSGGARVYGDARAGTAGSVTEGYGTVVTGEATRIASPLVPPAVERIDLVNDDEVSLRWNREERLAGGAMHFKRIRLDGYAGLTIEGPADIVVDDLQLGTYAWIYFDVAEGPVTLTVNKKLELANYAWIAPTSLQARDLTIRYAASRRIQMNYGSRLLGDILAPKADIWLGSAAEIYGRAQAKSLDLQYAAELHLDLDLLRVP